MQIKSIDIYTPDFYQIIFKDEYKHYYVILDLQKDVQILIRQVLILNTKTLKLEDATFNKKEIEKVKKRIKGFTKPRNLVSFLDIKKGEGGGENSIRLDKQLHKDTTTNL